MGTGRRVGVGTGYHHQASEVGTVLSPRSRFVSYCILLYINKAFKYVLCTLIYNYNKKITFVFHELNFKQNLYFVQFKIDFIKV